VAYSACNEKENVPWTNFTIRLTPEREEGLFVKGVTPLLSTYLAGKTDTHIGFPEGGTATVPRGLHY